MFSCGRSRWIWVTSIGCWKKMYDDDSLMIVDEWLILKELRIHFVRIINIEHTFRKHVHDGRLHDRVRERWRLAADLEWSLIFLKDWWKYCTTYYKIRKKNYDILKLGSPTILLFIISETTFHCSTDAFHDESPYFGKVFSFDTLAYFSLFLLLLCCDFSFSFQGHFKLASIFSVAFHIPLTFQLDHRTIDSLSAWVRRVNWRYYYGSVGRQRLDHSDGL